jgi:hypothetical protein
MLNLLGMLFGCRHQTTSQPFTRREGWPHKTYIVCLDCGAHLDYNLETMRAGDLLPQQRTEHPDAVYLARQKEATQ